jgi:hypothetical protein
LIGLRNEGIAGAGFEFRASNESMSAKNGLAVILLSGARSPRYQRRAPKV